MFVVRAAKDWVLLIEQHKKASVPAFLTVFALYLCVGMLWPKQYTGSAQVELNPSINWQPDINNQHLTATSAIRSATSRADWAAIVERLHLYPQTVADGRLAEAADYLAAQVSIKQIEDAAHGGLIVRIDYTDPNRNVALGITQAVVDNLTRPVPPAEAELGVPLPPLSHSQAAPPMLKASTRKQRKAHASAERQNAPSEAELAQQLQARLAEGSRLQDALGRNTIELNGLRDQLAQAERQSASTIAEPVPQRIPAAPAVDPRLEHLREELARAQQALLELRQRYTDDYPDVVAAREHVQDLQLDITRIAALAPAPAAKAPANDGAAQPKPVTAASASLVNVEAAHREILRRVNETQAAQDKLRQDIDRNRAVVARLQSEMADRKTTAANPSLPIPSNLSAAAQAGTAAPSGDVGGLPVNPPGTVHSGMARLPESTPLATSLMTSSAPLSLAQSPTVVASPQIFAGWILWFISAALATLAAFIAAWLVELRDPSIRTERRLRRELPVSAEYLGGIPRVRHEAVP
jgi:hypothetical protein